MSTPTSLREWETALTDHFLRVKDDGNVLPIRHFDITAESLASSCSVDDNKAINDTASAFVEACRSWQTVAALKDGNVNLNVQGTPGFFVFLALTIYVDNAMFDASVESGDFRKKLSALLDPTHRFQQLQGVERMWLKLKDWLDDQAVLGGYRRLAMPQRPPSWTHIGYTKRLSFPTRSDLREGAKVLEHSPDCLDSASTVIRAFQRYRDKPTASIGFQDAFDGFCRSRQKGNRHLGNHPFWTFALRCANSSPAGAVHIDRQVRAQRDEFDDFRFTVSPPSDIGPNAGTLGELLRAYGRCRGLAMAKRGALVFRTTGYGTWHSVADLSECRSTILLACDQRYAAQVTSRRVEIVTSGGWVITSQPMTISKAEDILGSLGIIFEEPDTVAAIGIEDGVRTGGAWLGRSSFLPKVTFEPSNLKIVACEEPGATMPTCSEVPGGGARLQSSEPLQGTFQISAFEHPSQAEPFWSRRMRFERNAIPHADEIKSGDHLQPYPDLQDIVSAGPPDVARALSRETADPAMDDLLEAIYAAGRVGWDEGDLVRLVRRADVGPISPWALLRSLQGAGTIEPRLRSQWKGRVWFLKPPEIEAVGTQSQTLAFITGAICQRQARDFEYVVQEAGGRSFRLNAAGGGRGASMIGCTGVAEATLAERLGWPTVKSPARTRMLMKPAMTMYRPMPSYIASVLEHGAWRTMQKGNDQPPGTVIRHSHPSDADHDIFEVKTSADPIYTISNTAAFVHSAVIQGRALYRVEDDHLVGAQRGIALPTEIALALRRRALRNPGTVDGHHCYRVERGDHHWLASTLGPLLDIKSTRTTDDGMAAASRHRPGRDRVLWDDSRARAPMIPRWGDLR
ncbi:MAG: hypothetical protein K2P80_02865 [Beijerinckiaceae bacterium]|nr:hypothetical protein [Beijerinckiaceae bacterium]